VLTVEIIDRLINISIGNSRKSMNWQASQTTIADFRKRLASPVRGPETLAEYLSLKKAAQDDLKDIGGFVGGSLNNPRRKATNVTGRDIITLDADNIPAGQTNDIKLRVSSLGIKSDIYSTAKHHGAAPRLRILFYIDRTVNAEEYEPCARKMAQYIDPSMVIFDPTTFEVARLMYFPRCSSDSEFVYESYEGLFVSADGLLAQYADWRDVSLWPALPGAQAFTKLAVKQGDPDEKKGVVGAFCRTYDVYRAMDELIPGIYEPVDNTPGRYTYLGGSTTGGAVLYDNGKFLYSHHATDPCGGRLVNAFDLVRLHKFAELDDAAQPNTPTGRLPSYLKMIELSMENKEIAAAVAKDRMGAAGDFEGVGGEGLDWAAELQPGAQGGYQRSLHNFILVLQHHPDLHGCVQLDLFSNKKIAAEGLPWLRTAEDATVWGDEDTTELCIWMERIFGKVTRSDIRSAINALALRQSFHPVRDYLSGLYWDGVMRLDSLFIDYMGAEDDGGGYTRAVTRKSLVAAVARVMTPGCKYDYMPVLIGKQGGKKSMLFDILAGGTKFFSDSLKTFEGQRAQEGVRGKWILEIAEMQTLDKTNVNAAKGFITQRADYYRAAYGEEAKDYPRQCAFFGTSNDYECLRDDTGGRRFWPVQTDVRTRRKNVTTDLPEERDQIWAEAVTYWRLGETLYLPPEQETVAAQMQEDHREAHPWEDTIIGFVNREIPVDWDKWELPARRAYYEGKGNYTGETKPRDKVCIAEIWLEALEGISINRIALVDKRVIRNVLNNIPGWEKSAVAMRFGKIYGVQKGYFKT
jgi:predicted P-loop ATPase